jgi:hypothetical protein
MSQFWSALRFGATGLLFGVLAVSFSGSARADCQAGYGACPANLGGGCAPIGSVCCPGGSHVGAGQTCPPVAPVSPAPTASPAPTTSPAATGNYGATAAGISGDQVGVGYSTNYPSQSEADAKALQECEARTNNCKVVGRFLNGGCGYITTAKSSGTCYGYGSTPDLALKECQSRGCTCQTPIGGCTAAP